MKTFIGAAVIGLLLGALAAPAQAVEGTALTLTDFQASYAGTKPMIAHIKYAQYKALEEYPEPTLTVQNIRMDVPVKGGGTKPHVTPAQAVYEPWTPGARNSGTKPIVGF